MRNRVALGNSKSGLPYFWHQIPTTEAVQMDGTYFVDLLLWTGGQLQKWIRKIGNGFVSASKNSVNNISKDNMLQSYYCDTDYTSRALKFASRFRYQIISWQRKDGQRCEDTSASLIQKLLLPQGAIVMILIVFHRCKVRWMRFTQHRCKFSPQKMAEFLWTTIWLEPCPTLIRNIPESKTKWVNRLRIIPNLNIQRKVHSSMWLQCSHKLKYRILFLCLDTGRPKWIQHD